jgi:hypothetical protein
VVLVFICLWVILFIKNVFLITILHFLVIPDGQFFMYFNGKKFVCQTTFYQVQHYKNFSF